MFPRLPPVTKALLIANGVVFVLQLLLRNSNALDIFQLWPIGLDQRYTDAAPFMPWQLVTYGFMHDPNSVFHLLFNMLALAMFGAPLEYTWGNKRFATYYFTCIVGAALCQLGVAWWAMQSGNAAGPTLGASGAIFGLLLAYGMLFPNQRVMLLFPPIPMKARTLVILYAAIELMLGLNGWQPGVAHFAHLGGMLFGWLLILYWRRPRNPPRKPPRRRHLRSVN